MKTPLPHKTGGAPVLRLPLKNDELPLHAQTAAQNPQSETPAQAIAARALPPLLQRPNGQTVQNDAQWPARRAEIMEVFAREVYGRSPQIVAANYKQYKDHQNELPFDQHWLLATIAARLLYVVSANDDAWADPKSEFLGALAASPFDRKSGRGFTRWRRGARLLPKTRRRSFAAGQSLVSRAAMAVGPPLRLSGRPHCALGFRQLRVLGFSD